MDIFPDFNFYNTIIDPWTEFPMDSFLIVLMGFLVAATCGLIGSFTVLRKMSLIGDALSHSLLPGIALAFLVAASRNTSILFLGAILSALVAVFLIEYIPKRTPVKLDATMGIVFSTLFALGVVLITLFADHIDLDTECVLYGEIAFIPLEEPLSLAGINLGPYPIPRMFMLLVGLSLSVWIFYKQILVSIFDPIHAHCIGISSNKVNWAITFILSLVIVSAFKSVGAILVVAMLLFPTTTSLLISKKLKNILLLTFPLALTYSLVGYHLAVYLDASIAGSMAMVGFAIFLMTALIYSLKRLSVTKN